MRYVHILCCGIWRLSTIHVLCRSNTLVTFTVQQAAYHVTCVYRTDAEYIAYFAGLLALRTAWSTIHSWPVSWTGGVTRCHRSRWNRWVATTISRREPSSRTLTWWRSWNTSTCSDLQSHIRVTDPILVLHLRLRLTNYVTITTMTCVVSRSKCDVIVYRVVVSPFLTACISLPLRLTAVCRRIFLSVENIYFSTLYV